MNRETSAKMSSTWPLICAASFAAAILGAAPAAHGQWMAQQSDTRASFRGMSVVNGTDVWVSGTAGTYARSTDAGRTWHVGHVPGAESFDFRAIHAISPDTVVLMASVQDTALIYRTTDGGSRWTVVYRNERKGAFLDGMAFLDSRHGLAVGDPLDGRFVILETTDGGDHWARIPAAGLPPSLPGEGAFAASGTSMTVCGPRDVWLGTGATSVARVFHSADGGHNWSVVVTPIAAGPSAGIFSLACRDQSHLIAVGGNYSKPDATATTVAWSDDGGATWTAAKPSPATSYLSGVTFLHSATIPGGVLAVGTEGTAFSLDDGRTWARLDSLSLNVVMSLGSDSALAAGSRGRIVSLTGLQRH
jgi:photosystem II stability/assembly factor-like uncharacterized protein